MKTTLFYFSLFIFFVGCNTDDYTGTFQPTTVSFTIIGQGELSGNGAENIDPSNLVINNQTDWQNLINQMNTANNVSDTFSETTLDFDNYILIAVILDIKPNGWMVEIDSIIENENDISVSTQETESISTVITQPYCIVKIPKTSKNIIFYTNLP